MSGLSRSAARFNKKHLPLRDPLMRKVDDAASKTRFSPRIPQNNEPVIPLPDEEALERANRRTRSRRSGGRVATVLSGGDQDTVG